MVLLGVAIWAIANCPSGPSCLLTSTRAQGLRHKIATPPLLVEYLERGSCRSCQPRFLATWAIPGAATALMFVSCKVITWTPSWTADKRRFFPFVFHDWIFWDHNLSLLWLGSVDEDGPGCAASPTLTPLRPRDVAEFLMVEGLSGWCFSLFLFLFLKLRVGVTQLFQIAFRFWIEGIGPLAKRHTCIGISAEETQSP